jgi:hypothetical protein
VNLPRNQKKLLRIPPSLTLEQVFRSICEEKHFEPSRYVFQLPNNPYTGVDMKATIAELRINEINLIAAGR